jgi:hypothetical protein
MPKPLTKEDVIQRLHVFPLESYALIANVAKGIALGVGSLALLQIFSDSAWIRLVPWSASLIAVLLSYVKWTRGTVLCNAHANVWDSFFPLLMGIAEFLLFGILAIENPTSFLWLNWPICLAAHALIAALLVNNRLRLTNVAKDFDNEVSDLGNEYKGWLKSDRIQAASFGIVAVAVWVLTRVWILPSYGAGVCAYVVGGFALFILVAAWKPISDANSQRNRIDEFVSSRRPKPLPAVA